MIDHYFYDKSAILSVRKEDNHHEEVPKIDEKAN